MWKSEIGAVVAQEFDQTGIVGKNIHRPRFDLSKHTSVEIFNLKQHVEILATEPVSRHLSKSKKSRASTRGIFPKSNFLTRR